MGGPFLRLLPSLGPPSARTVDLDALGAAAESHFGDSVTRYSYDGWEPGQPAEPSCYVTNKLIFPGRPLAQPANILARFPFYGVHSFRRARGLLAKVDGIALQIHNPTTPLRSQQPARRLLYVHLLRHPWIMQGFHSTVSWHLGAARTLRVLKYVHWWVKISTFTLW